MGIYDYKNLGTTESKALVSDAMAIMLYSYHNLDHGFAAGYQQNGFGAGLPATLVTALLGSTDSQGVIPGVPWNPDSEQLALEAVQQAGWTPISASQLGYTGKVDDRGTFFGEKAGYTTAQVEILGKYDADGQLTQIGVSFRGTSGPRETLISDSIGDVISDLMAAFGPQDYAKNYVGQAFGNLLGDVAAFAQAHGLTGQDVLVSGHSLGGLAVNSLADLSASQWSGFYSSAHYIAYASPTQNSTDKVLNIGYENDPVFRALDGSTFTPASVGVHDAQQASATNNIVSFNDHYASAAWNVLPFSILNIPTWISHLPTGYGDGMGRILDSAFYDLTEKDSTVIVANLSDPARSHTWVQDLNRNAETHTGSTFIIGSDGDDLIQGGQGNDYLEGRAGNDTFRDAGGYNVILGGQGSNTLQLQHSVKDASFVQDGAGTLYLRDAQGAISMTRDIDTLVSKEPGLFWGLLKDEVSHSVTANGLVAGGNLTAYASSTTGTSADDTLTARSSGDWLFGHDGNDVLLGGTGNDTFVGGLGDDLMQSGGGADTFLFNGAFGHDLISGYDAGDTLVFLGVQGVGAGYDYRQHLSQVGSDTLLEVGENSVTLVGINPGQVGGDIVFA
ncbi:polyurethane esterase [Pseudomonas fluorescens]|uniref:Polyurethanase n=1 Tax=Pseudomonas fluorescens TaxID=294 RepID=A0A944DJ41_PSEFL|nr:polyurethanase [Pseudomonas fluorescens]MBT2298412.1 polyurethanase [Pseudomonas fluorescens]MBT2309938.1 polyurethanase [Pseudomonas fluorescens]MBT2310961.1 polyurethanase [Pseudomonas fluorescens]MBT2320104.1 polyurethanase [Pseudomonas fluorescens]MBT2328868.1 polyurethanase [Pseudomonas fluorescens]